MVVVLLEFYSNHTDYHMLSKLVHHRFFGVKVYTPEVQSYLDNVCKHTPNNIFINSHWLVERVAVAQVEKSLSTAANIAGCEGRLPTPPTISPLQASLLGWGLQSHALDVALLIGCVRVQNAQPVRLAVTDVEQPSAFRVLHRERVVD